MKISALLDNNEILTTINEAKKGKFYNYRRTYAVEVEGKVHRVTMNIFERIINFLFFKPFGLNLIKRKFENKPITFLSEKDLVRFPVKKDDIPNDQSNILESYPEDGTDETKIPPTDPNQNQPEIKHTTASISPPSGKFPSIHTIIEDILEESKKEQTQRSDKLKKDLATAKEKHEKFLKPFEEISTQNDGETTAPQDPTFTSKTEALKKALEKTVADSVKNFEQDLNNNRFIKKVEKNETAEKNVTTLDDLTNPEVPEIQQTEKKDNSANEIDDHSNDTQEVNTSPETTEDVLQKITEETKNNRAARNERSGLDPLAIPRHRAKVVQKGKKKPTTPRSKSCEPNPAKDTDFANSNDLASVLRV